MKGNFHVRFLGGPRAGDSPGLPGARAPDCLPRGSRNTGSCLARHAIFAAMPEASAKDRILDALKDLPSDATVDDAIDRLVFLAKVQEGLAELDGGAGIPHDEVRRRLGL